MAIFETPSACFQNGFLHGHDFENHRHRSFSSLGQNGSITMLIDLVQLRTFVAVAEEQHLTRAAERLHISQSAASAHVRAIEENLDVRLFNRTNRNLELTRTGELLLLKAKALLGEATLFASYAQELRGKIEGTLVVGSSSDPSASRFGNIMATLRERHPLIKLDVRVRPSSGTRQGLKIGEVDVGIVLDRPTDPALRYYELTTVPFRVVGPVAWKEQIENADWTALASLPWLTPMENSTAYVDMLRRLFDDRGLELNSVIRFDNSAIARTMLQAGVGMMLMREEHALQGEKDGVLAVSPLARAEYGLYIAHLNTRKNDPLIRAFIDVASTVWPEMRVNSVQAP